jgi:hypothetical protein
LLDFSGTGMATPTLVRSVVDLINLGAAQSTAFSSSHV